MNTILKRFTGLVIILSNVSVYSMQQESKKPHGNKVGPDAFSSVLPGSNNNRTRTVLVSRQSPSKTDIKELDQEAENYFDFYQEIFNGDAKRVSTWLAEHKYPSGENIKQLTARALRYAIQDSEICYALRDGKSPFWFAVSLALRDKGYGAPEDRMEVIQEFLTSKHSEDIDINEKRYMDLAVGKSALDRCTCTLLHMATQLQDYGIMQLLIDSKADVNAADEHGKQARHYARDNKDDEARNILLDTGDVATHRKKVKVSIVFESFALVGIYKAIFEGNCELLGASLTQYGYPDTTVDTKKVAQEVQDLHADIKIALEQERSPFWFSIYVRLKKKKTPQQLVIIQELLKCNPEINEVGKFGPKENPVTIFCKAKENKETDPELFAIINKIKGRNKLAPGSSKSSQPGGCCVIM